MNKLPVVSGKDAVKALKKAGYEFDWQKGSHMVLRLNKPPYRRITIPNHREIAKGTLKAILRETGLTADEFIDLLK